MHRRMGWVALAGVWLLAAAPAQAHMRNFIETQDYYTTARGEVEVELHNDYDLPTAGEDGTFHSKHQIEVEYGLTDHLQVAGYEVYTWDRKNDWERDKFKLELKGRLAEAGQWPVDVALYTEYANPNGSRDAHSDAWENKLILAKDIGLLHVAANLVGEKAINEAAPWEWEYTLGASYLLTPRVRPMLEYKEALGNTDGVQWFANDHEAYVMPGAAVMVAPHVNLVAGLAFGVTDVSDEVRLKSIMEFEF